MTATGDVSGGASNRPPRSGRPRDPARGEVIRAATLQLLAEVGYDAVTVDAVAAAAGAGKATVYRRWPTRVDLIADVIAALGSGSAAPDTGSLRGDLCALLRELAAFLDGAGGAAARAVLSASVRQPALAQALRAGLTDPWCQAIACAWQRAADRGELAPAVNLPVAAEATGALFFQRWALNEPIEATLIEAALDMLIPPTQRHL